LSILHTNTARHSIVDDSVTLRFVASPPGLDPLVDFTLTPIPGTVGLYSMTAVLDPATRLFLLDPGAHFAEYSPIISDDHCASLSIHSPEDALILVVVNAGPDGTAANLVAPIVVNAETGIAAQVILDGQDFPLRAIIGAPRED
jgi:flagellar assembly factor FliW